MRHTMMDKQTVLARHGSGLIEGALVVLLVAITLIVVLGAVNHGFRQLLEALPAALQ